MAVIYGASVWQEHTNASDERADVLGKNSEVIAAGDILAIASGLVAVSTAATDVLYGVAQKTATMASNNQTVAKVTPSFVPIAPDTIFLMGCDADLTGNATDVGTYYGISTGGTGIQQVRVSAGVTSTTSRQFEIVKVDPRGVGGTAATAGNGLRECLVRILKTPYSNITAT